MWLEPVRWELPCCAVVNILEGLASNAIFLVIVVLLGGITYVVVRRRALISFFALRKSRRLVIYSSTLRIPSGGSAGVDGRPRTFQGIAIPDYEVTAATKLQSIFASAAPGVSGISGWLRHLRFVDLDVVVEASPRDRDDVTRQDTFVTIGSPGYNAGSRAWLCLHLPRSDDVLRDCWGCP
jgi:hypothetical protein